VTRRRFPLWALLGVVVVVTLLVGSGVFNSSPPTAAQRAASLESVVRCPTCEDLSVAQSTAPAAVAVRTAIVQLIADGRTDQQIEAYLVDRYGPSIVLDPPADGWTVLVWLLPLVGGLAATAGVVAVLVRRRRIDNDDGGGGGGGADDGLTPGMAEERRNFLVRSLADADAEYLAGDLSDQDYLALRQRDMVRLAALDARAPATAGSGGTATLATAGSGGTATLATAGASLAVEDRVDDGAAAGEDAEADDAPAPTARRRLRRSTWFLVIGCACLAAALIVAVVSFASNRAPGQSITGTFAQSPTQQIEETLAQAATDENQGEAGQAAQLYQSVLDKHPDNEVALAQLGWLEYQTGEQGNSASLIADARAKLDRSVALDPGDYAARLYLGTLLLQRDGNAAGAVAQYQRFLADSPPAALLAQAAPEIRAAYTQAGEPVPASVPAG
jgi:cytochrome c-type biogenesis protein CcmH